MTAVRPPGRVISTSYKKAIGHWQGRAWLAWGAGSETLGISKKIDLKMLVLYDVHAVSANTAINLCALRKSIIETCFQIVQ